MINDMRMASDIYGVPDISGNSYLLHNIGTLGMFYISPNKRSFRVPGGVGTDLGL